MTSVIILYPFSIILNASENMTAFFDIRILFSLFVPYETAGFNYLESTNTLRFIFCIQFLYQIKFSKYFLTVDIFLRAIISCKLSFKKKFD